MSRTSHLAVAAILSRLSVATLLCAAPEAAAAQPASQELKGLSLEELMQVEVTLVTRQPEQVGTAAAAVSVITREDIRRSGVTTLADAIALADGVHVARFNNGTWSISARGFNGSTPNKLLVMVDGRNEFTPLFAGVFWNTLDYVLDDIERIEVIRGPGATLWGANAVNGVINIVTRHARDTRGTFVSVTSGNEDPRPGGGRATAAVPPRPTIASTVSSASATSRSSRPARQPTIPVVAGRPVSRGSVDGRNRMAAERRCVSQP